MEEIFEIGAEIDEEIIVDAMGDEKGGPIRRSIQTKGTDGLAWYTTFHAIGAQWGIYIPVSSIFYLTSNVFNKLDTDWDTKFRIAFRALHQHELFHFAVDYLTSQWEAFTGKPCHKPARRLKNPEKGYNILEETLANAGMLRSLLFGNSRQTVTTCA